MTAEKDSDGSVGDDRMAAHQPSRNPFHSDRAEDPPSLDARRRDLDLEDEHPAPAGNQRWGEDAGLRGPLAMVRVGRGDVEAFQAVYDAFRSDVHAFLSRIVLDPDAADDLLQDTFLRVFREAARYDPCRPLEPWIFRIARNLALDHLRSRKRRTHTSMTASDESTIDVADDTTDPVDAAVSREREALLREGLSRLRPSQREIFVLIDLEGRKYEEVANLLGISVKAVGARLRKARRRFLQWAKPHEKQLTDTFDHSFDSAGASSDPRS